MLTKAVNPSLGSTNGLNTDHANSEGVDIAIVKRTEKDSGRVWVIDSIFYSFKTTEPVDSRIYVLDGEKVVFDMWISKPQGEFQLYIPASNDKNLTIFMKGVEGVFGKLNTMTHEEGA